MPQRHVTNKSKVRLLAGILCVVAMGGAVARIAHLRSIHRTPRLGGAICGGELVPCHALGLANLSDGSSNYNPCWEARQPPKRSPRWFEGMELALLRKMDEAQCAAVGTVARIVMGP
jgi:hypothetical protein